MGDTAEGSDGDIPQLAGDALGAVRHRGSHLQIIASAGSGKTEAVAQRIADLLADGVAPSAIVAFTFTERAADSLKSRVEQRVQARLGRNFLDRMNGCFIGTIHAYCFRLLQEHIPRFETYDVLDENRLAAFLTREANTIGFKSLSPRGQLFEGIEIFTNNVDVVDNERVPLAGLTEPFRTTVERFRTQLDRYRLLTYGQIITQAVEELSNPEVFRSVHDGLRHLIVDEYQDVNPAQEALIARLATTPVELCIVGDDDQSIYQWRGSDVENILQFALRYPDVAQFSISVNRRSRPGIIRAANGFAKTIAKRLTKQMAEHRPADGAELVVWHAVTEADEAETIALNIERVRAMGYRYRDMAILVRGSASYPKLLDAFARHSIPVQPGGRTGLFLERDAQLFGWTFAYLAGHDWREEKFGRGRKAELPDVVNGYAAAFSLGSAKKAKITSRLTAWRREVQQPTKPANLIDDYYALLADCGLAGWDFGDKRLVGRLGALARCSMILADYESIRRRSRPDDSVAGEVVGGQDRGEWYFRWLAIHIQNWALGAFEGFEGEDDITLDAVDLTTIHKAKGLEWPIVFVPCVSAKRFPSSKTGAPRQWHVPFEQFDRSRYEGTVNDERRLFYVAITRARDWLSVSTHDTPNVQRVAPSPFLLHLHPNPPVLRSLPAPPPPTQTGPTDEDLLAITFSELADFANCGLAYRLRNLIGFQPPIAPELGYGKAVHHVLREVAEHTRRYGRPPNKQQLDGLFDTSFFLPSANKVAHRQLKEAARRLVDRYVADYSDDLQRVWAVERPFELHLPNALISGRADVILDEENGQVNSLAIVDYKTATDGDREYDLQLQVYTDAGRREGLTVTAAYVHDLKDASRKSVDVSAKTVKQSEGDVIQLVDRLRKKDFTPSPATKKCAACDVRPMCQHAV